MTNSLLWYVAGPMRGIPEFNFPAFDAERDRLLALGQSVISPADVDRELGFAPGETSSDVTSDEVFAIYMRRDIAILLDVDAISFLPGWKNSAGANVEYVVGKALNLHMTFPPGEEPDVPVRN